MDKALNGLHPRTMVADESFRSRQPVRHIRRDRGNTLCWQGPKQRNENVASTAMGIPDARLVCGRILLLHDVLCGRLSHDGIKQNRGFCSNADRCINGCECRVEFHFFPATFIAMEFLVLRAIYRARGRADKHSVVC